MISWLRFSVRRYSPTIPFKLADIGEGIKEVEVIQWLVKEGQQVKQFDRIAEVQSDKATVEITSRYDGRIVKLHYGKGEMAQVGEPLVDIEVSEGTVGSKAKDLSKAKVESKVESEESTGRSAKESNQKFLDDAIEVAEGGVTPLVKAMPSVRLLAKKMGIDLGSVKATGHQGQVTRADVLSHTTSAAPSTHIASRKVQLTAFQRAMVKRMEMALKIPHFGYCDQWEVERLLAVKQDLQGHFQTVHQQKLTLLPFIIKATSMALQEYPQLNGWYHGGPEIEYRGEHNISIAIDTPHGLAVPNLKQVQYKSILQISQELANLTRSARSNSLSKEQIEGGTICLSNIGSLGGVWASPIIMSPQLIIGAIGRQEDGKLPMSWAADHRVVDGATVAKFSARIHEILRQPSLLLL